MSAPGSLYPLPLGSASHLASPLSCIPAAPHTSKKATDSLRRGHKVLSKSLRPCTVSTRFSDLTWFPFPSVSGLVYLPVPKYSQVFPAFQSQPFTFLPSPALSRPAPLHSSGLISDTPPPPPPSLVRPKVALIPQPVILFLHHSRMDSILHL